MTHGSARPLVAALVVLALAGACQATTTPTPSAEPATATPSATPAQATPSPAATPTPQATPASTPEPTPSPTIAPEPQAYTADGEASDVRFAPDGRIVLVTRDLTAGSAHVITLDASGAVLPGWPWSAGTTGNPFATAVLGPDESTYVAVRTEKGDPPAYAWTLHRLDAGAREMAGFPVPLPAGPFCTLAASPDGLATTACETGDDPGPSTATFSAVRPDGSMASGWPVTMAGSPSVEGFLPDGTLVAWVAAGNGSAKIVALRTDGSPAPGWPVAAPKDGGSVAIDGAGRVRITTWAWSEGQCGPATGTRYTVLGADGKPLPGWPVAVKGWASEPLVADDGSMTIVTARGRAFRYGLDGAAAAGWTASTISVDESCYGGSTPVAVDGGSTLVIGGRVTLLDASGAVAPGWPARLAYDIAHVCPDCTPGPNAPLDPAIGADGIYVGAYGKGPRVVALGRDGAPIDGSSRVIGKDGDMLDWVRIAPAGRVWALLRRSADESSTAILVPVAQDRVPAR